MGTVNKQIADLVIANHGRYPGDHVKYVKVVTYNNQFDGKLEYATVHERENPMRYEESAACHNVRVIWHRDWGIEPGYCNHEYAPNKADIAYLRSVT